jgi:ATP-dependent DNA ligase
MPPVKPMRAKPVTETPTGGVLYERKWDGFRCIMFRDGGRVTATSR